MKKLISGILSSLIMLTLLAGGSNLALGLYGVGVITVTVLSYMLISSLMGVKDNVTDNEAKVICHMFKTNMILSSIILIVQVIITMMLIGQLI